MPATLLARMVFQLRRAVIGLQIPAFQTAFWWEGIVADCKGESVNVGHPFCAESNRVPASWPCGVGFVRVAIRKAGRPLAGADGGY